MDHPYIKHLWTTPWTQAMDHHCLELHSYESNSPISVKVELEKNKHQLAQLGKKIIQLYERNNFLCTEK